MRWVLALPALALVLAPVGGLVAAAGLPLPAEAVAALARGMGVAVASAALALAVGLPAGLALRTAGPRGRGIVLALLALPWLVPAEVLALAVAPVVGRAGGGAAGVILAGALLAAGPVTLAGWLAIRGVAEVELRVAALAGATPGLILRRLLLPRLARGAAIGAALGGAAAAGQATVAARIGPPGWRGLPAALPDWLRDAAGPEALPGVALAALLALLPAGVACLCFVLALRRRGAGTAGREPHGRRDPARPEHPLRRAATAPHGIARAGKHPS
ncbi:hypothetical protein ACE7GA_10255 [Roseomonas sp. CCTCC AB2023176]|uniref:hypothetical protein n=1 Tax=Roseomonas sp. CCTCC AB2023176 TaxID=3342640 RepID=UPI0035DCD0EE